MKTVNQLEPKEVFRFFGEICNIPHGSGNVEQISDYLKNFAKERDLFCIQDELKNIIIVKEASKGYESEPPIMLQGHMDMVTVSKPDKVIDMTKEGLSLRVNEDSLYAEGTSLGADNGIAVAYAMALLDSHTISHPKLEVVITVDEEVGMDGARGIDLSMLESKRMLNLDSEEEGIFWTSCAGGARVKCTMDLKKTLFEGIFYEIKIKGLVGGHSGTEIIKERGNSNVLMGRLLWELLKVYDFGVHEIGGGLADNAIPRETGACVIVREEEAKAFLKIIQKVEKEFQNELGGKDPGVHIEVIERGREKAEVVRGILLEKAVAMIYAAPSGVQGMSADIEGLVETSLNMGILYLNEFLQMEFSVRSSLESAKWSLIDKITAIMMLAGGKVEISGDYPGWAFRTDSPLREKMIKIYERLYGKKPTIAAIHAGLECGLISAKLKDLDCVSLGPDMKNIHTTEESLSISSTLRTWEFLVELLKEKE